MKLSVLNSISFSQGKTVKLYCSLFILCAFALGQQTSPVWATEEAKVAVGQEIPAKAVAGVVVAPRSDYCANIAKPAAEARYAFQLKTLQDLSEQVDQKLAILEEKRQYILAFKADQKKQEIIAQKLVVDIFAKMKPDVAARQLEKVDLKTSVSILSQLNVRSASTILDEMSTDKAAAIAATMAMAQASIVGTQQ